MYDRQTESLWVHVTAKAETGPLKGQQLTLMPSTVTTWETWKAAHPHSLVLPGYRRGGFMGTYKGVYQTRGFGLAVYVGFEAKLYPFKQLKQHRVVNDRIRDTELTVAFFAATNTATVWKRQVNGRSLTFAPTTQHDERGTFLMQDQETGSLWSSMIGTALAGELTGQKLEPLVYHPILTDRFHAFYPDGEVFN
ncbi:hypothetical protein NKDENANG_00994 [Candidatus Entotheonellaceae bacterium PAL068K]